MALRKRKGQSLHPPLGCGDSEQGLDTVASPRNTPWDLGSTENSLAMSMKLKHWKTSRFHFYCFKWPGKFQKDKGPSNYQLWKTPHWVGVGGHVEEDLVSPEGTSKQSVRVRLCVSNSGFTQVSDHKINQTNTLGNHWVTMGLKSVYWQEVPTLGKDKSNLFNFTKIPRISV